MDGAAFWLDGRAPVIALSLRYDRIDWFWFVLSQVGFGLVAGVVVSRQERIPTWQAVPLAVRLGVEAPGLVTANEGNERP